jgi:uncharacterized protein (TIGR03118 family)
VGALATAALSFGIGCGDQGSSPVTVASSDLHVMKKITFESIVKEEDLVSNRAPVDAVEPSLDEHLVNAWGLAFSDDGLAFVAANHDGTDRVYDEEGDFHGAITIPPPPNHDPPAAPTGQVKNPFPFAFRGDDFIVVSEDGTVVGIQVEDRHHEHGKHFMVKADAILRVNNADDADPDHRSIYKGVALSTVHGKPRLFATDFHNGKIDVFDERYGQLDTNGGFTDPNLPAGFAPFNMLAIAGERLIVTYALQDDTAEDDQAGPGNGFVDLYDTRGKLLARLVSGMPDHPELNSPWGLALSREHAGDVDLLVGNFGDGHVNVYALDPVGRHADLEGQLGVFADKTFQPLVISGLWAIVFGNGKGGFDADDLYFAAGPDNGPNTALEENGLFGELDFVGPRI